MALAQNGMVIDLSHWNTVTDWRAVAASGVVGVVHKFSQGTGYRDPMYAAARKGALENGMLFGRYHFAEGSDVKAQVRNFIEAARDDELLALDWEDNSNSAGTMSLSQAVAFVQEVHAATGQMPVLYGGNTIKEALGTPNPTLARCRLWLAHYAAQPVCPPGWREPWLWQWTDKGSCPGIVGDVDQDAWQGSEMALRSEWTGGKDLPSTIEPPPATDTVTIAITVPKGAKVEIFTTGDAANVIT